MSDYYRTYQEARAAAEAAVRAAGLPHGLEAWRSACTPGMRYRVFMVPRDPRNRTGHEVRCEVIEAEKASGEEVSR